MNCNISNPLKLKDGRVYPKGTSMKVSVDQKLPMLACLEDPDGRKFKIKSLSLHRYFEEFDKPDFTDRAALMDSAIPSLTGDMVEPDGWDEQGFPSVLLAAGMI